MKRLIAVCLAALLISGLFSVCSAEEIGLQSELEEYAAGHAEKLNALLDCQDYLNMMVAQLYPDDGSLLKELEQVDFTDPRKKLILIKQEEELTGIEADEIPDEMRKLIEEYAFTEYLLAPLTVPRPENSMYTRRVIEDLIIREAITLPELTGAAYLIQLYEASGEETGPFLVSAFIAQDESNVLMHTEIVYGEEGHNGAEDRFVGFLSLIDRVTGGAPAEDYISITYREKNADE